MSTEDLTALEKELERLKKKQRKGLWKVALAVVLSLIVLLFVYDLFQDLEAQKALVRKYELQIKKLKAENTTLSEELSRCQDRVNSLSQGGVNGRDRGEPER